MATYMPWLASALFSIVGIISIVVGFSTRRRYAYMQTWPTADAVITNTDIQENWGAEDSEGFSTKIYQPGVYFRFKVARREYCGWTSKWERNNREEAERVLEDYPVGKKITIIYDPMKPDDNISDINEHAKGPEFIIAGFVLLIIGITVGVFVNQI